MIHSSQPEQQTTTSIVAIDKLDAFWRQGQFDSFQGVDNVAIHFAIFTQADASFPSLIIIPGRCESYLKYKEIACELFEQGYSIFIIDHRGQGLSGRMLSNRNKGYVNHFQDYVCDLSYFIEHIVTHHSTAKPYLLAHSMGGAIATRYMQDSPETIQAAVISSPMLGFNSKPIPEVLARGLIHFQRNLNRLFGTSPWYFFGQNDYTPTNFEDNKLTHSPERYQEFLDLYQRTEIIQLGGVTAHWLSECIAAQEVIFAKLAVLKTPILLLQAGSDSIVSLTAQDDFCLKLHQRQPQSCPEGKAVRFDSALHELFFEEDSIRAPAIAKALDWFSKHPQ